MLAAFVFLGSSMPKRELGMVTIQTHQLPPELLYTPESARPTTVKALKCSCANCASTADGEVSKLPRNTLTVVSAEPVRAAQHVDVSVPEATG
jgi:hypothetical protein